MDVGIGLPNAVKGVQREGIVDWARRAEAAGFSTSSATPTGSPWWCWAPPRR
jgi:hypothetical protein